MDATAPPPDRTWSRRTRLLITAWLVWHLAAIVVAPLAVGPSSMLFHRAWLVFHPYLQASYLNHGFHFFAPEPGPSHLIRYELTFADGTRRSDYFPNPQQHWSRLMYHRHFMLSEHLSGYLNEQGEPTPIVEAYSQSYGEHLLAAHQAKEVRLFLMRHRFPEPVEVLEGMPLNDPRLFLERPLGTYHAAASTTPVKPPRLTAVTDRSLLNLP